MRPLRIYLVILASLALTIPAIAQEIIVHEAWPIHMESAGGWVAVEKGFYGKLKVKEVQGGPEISPIQKVVAAVGVGQIAFGIDCPENIIKAREKEGLDLVAVSIDFQNSAMRIISWKPIKSAKDIKGDFGIWMGYDAKAKCAIGKGWEKQFTIQNQGEGIKVWLMGTWPLASAMTYNELIIAQRETKRMGKKFYTIDYKDLGIDWMDNVLFTTEEIVKKYPDVIQAVVTGRYRGFQWAFHNPKETFEIFKKVTTSTSQPEVWGSPGIDPERRLPPRPEGPGLDAVERVNEGLDFAREMDAVGPMKALMITPDTRKYGLGYINLKKWENITKDMFKAGLLEKMPEVKKVYTDKFPSGVLPK